MIIINEEDQDHEQSSDLCENQLSFTFKNKEYEGKIINSSSQSKLNDSSLSNRFNELVSGSNVINFKVLQKDNRDYIHQRVKNILQNFG